MVASQLLSAIAANRKHFFELVEAAELALGCRIDELALESEIDTAFSGREDLTEDEARSLLLVASRPPKTADGTTVTT